jgi:RHS repeat-associated protein
MTDKKGTVVWRADYRPFGEAAVDQDPDGDGKKVIMNLRFPGQYFDEETGLHYNWARDYNPTIGRYIGPVQIGLTRQKNEIKVLDQWAYRQNNPVDAKDINDYAKVRPFQVRGKRRPTLLRRWPERVPKELIRQIPEWVLHYVYEHTVAGGAAGVCATQACERGIRPRQEAYIMCIDIIRKIELPPPPIGTMIPSDYFYQKCREICVKITEREDFWEDCCKYMGKRG